MTVAETSCKCQVELEMQWFPLCGFLSDLIPQTLVGWPSTCDFPSHYFTLQAWQPWPPGESNWPSAWPFPHYRPGPLGSPLSARLLCVLSPSNFPWSMYYQPQQTGWEPGTIAFYTGTKGNAIISWVHHPCKTIILAQKKTDLQFSFDCQQGGYFLSTCMNQAQWT